MVPNHSIASVNQRLAWQINRDARNDPTSPYLGKFVGIANGQVVVVADTLDEVAVKPSPERYWPTLTYGNFAEPRAFKQGLDAMIQAINDSPPAEGCQRVLAPGHAGRQPLFPPTQFGETQPRQPS